ncbi:hypothetical protein OG206_28270 [Streptomyces sp. NBC_01341]|nr:hypothetical protein OG206_28270 [Streptomyces sp. NBC_01341]
MKRPLTVSRRDASTGPVLRVAGALDYEQADALRTGTSTTLS